MKHGLIVLSLAVSSLSVSGSAQAQRLVDTPAMCALAPDDIGQQELGMTLDATSFFAIEYYCEFDPPVALDWSRERMQTRVGYCSEPGLITPGVYTFQSSQYEPGLVILHQGDGSPPVEFRACP